MPKSNDHIQEISDFTAITRKLNPTECQRAADGLRLLAHWVEAHPDVQLPVRLSPGWENTFWCFLSEDKTRFRQQLRAIGPCEILLSDKYIEADVKVGHFTLVFCIELENLCTKQAVGTTKVPAEGIPSEFVPEEVIAAHTEGEEEPSEG